MCSRILSCLATRISFCNLSSAQQQGLRSCLRKLAVAAHLDISGCVPQHRSSVRCLFKCLMKSSVLQWKWHGASREAWVDILLSFIMKQCFYSTLPRVQAPLWAIMQHHHHHQELSLCLKKGSCFTFIDTVLVFKLGCAAARETLVSIGSEWNPIIPLIL